MHLEQLFPQLFILLLTSKLLTQLYLNKRQIFFVKAHSKNVPPEFEDQVTLEQHQKAASYTCSKTRFNSVNLLFEAIVLWLWITGGFLNQVDQWVRSYSEHYLVHGLLLFAVIGLISLLINLPFQLYSTFVIEEKFGFNKMNAKIFITDLLKQIVLSAALLLPLLAGLLWVMQQLGENWWIWGWTLFVLFQFLILLLYPNFIAPLFNQFSALEDGELKKAISQLLKKVEFKASGLFVMDASIRSSHGNAYFTGMGKTKRIVFFDTLIKKLSTHQVIAVLAHELGHFKHKHILKSLILSLIFSLIAFAILGQLYQNTAFFSGHGIASQSTAMALLLFSWLAPLYTFFLTPLFSFLSRKNEFEADEFAAKHSNAQDLIDALICLYKENASTLTPDQLYTRFYHSHPPAKERIEFLKGINSLEP